MRPQIIQTVDQPAGVGFSTCDEDYVTDEQQVAEDMYTFLTKFLQTYPQYAKLPFYIIGGKQKKILFSPFDIFFSKIKESYGGKRNTISVLRSKTVLWGQFNKKKDTMVIIFLSQVWFFFFFDSGF